LFPRTAGSTRRGSKYHATRTLCIEQWSDEPASQLVGGPPRSPSPLKSVRKFRDRTSGIVSKCLNQLQRSTIGRRGRRLPARSILRGRANHANRATYSSGKRILRQFHLHGHPLAPEHDTGFRSGSAGINTPIGLLQVQLTWGNNIRKVQVGSGGAKEVGLAPRRVAYPRAEQRERRNLPRQPRKRNCIINDMPLKTPPGVGSVGQLFLVQIVQESAPVSRMNLWDRNGNVACLHAHWTMAFAPQDGTAALSAAFRSPLPLGEG
jgi:hypothetical protein